MATVKLKVIQARELQRELYGFADEKGNVVLKGLLAQNISAALKFKLLKLGKQIQSELESVEEQRTDLIKKYGKTVKRDGQEVLEIQQMKLNKKGESTGEVTEEFTKFVEEFNALMNTDTEYLATKLTVEDLDFKTDEVYPLIFDFLVEQEQAPVEVN